MSGRPPQTTRRMPTPPSGPVIPRDSLSAASAQGNDPFGGAVPSNPFGRPSPGPGPGREAAMDTGGAAGVSQPLSLAAGVSAFAREELATDDVTIVVVRRLGPA